MIMNPIAQFFPLPAHDRQTVKRTQQQYRMKRQPFRYYLVTDLEATCEENNTNYRNEIIEFPLVLIEVDQRQQLNIIDHTQIYVKPTINPVLSDFCKNLTGISQDQVNCAETLDTVLVKIHDWLVSKNLIVGTYDEWTSGNQKGAPFAFITDGPYDLYKFLHAECEEKKITKPCYYSNWVNIRRVFGDHYKSNAYSLMHMMKTMGLTFEGKQHSGLDDSLNIGKIAMKLARDGAELQLNDSVDDHLPRMVQQTYEIALLFNIFTMTDSLDPTSTIHAHVRAVNTTTLQAHGEDYSYTGQVVDFLKDLTKWMRSNSLIKSRFAKQAKKQKKILSNVLLFKDSTACESFRQICLLERDTNKVPKSFNKCVDLTQYCNEFNLRHGSYIRVENTVDNYQNILCELLSKGTVLSAPQRRK